MDNGVYIKGAWVFLLAMLFFYSGTFIHFTGDDMQVLSNGATLSDWIYFNCIKIAAMFGGLAFSSLCIYLCSTHTENRALYYIKYLSYAISAILFTRMSFHFRFYEEIPNVELICYGLIVIGVVVRSAKDSKLINTLKQLCRKLMNKYQSNGHSKS